MQTPVIFVIGPPGHGKTAARKILAELTKQKGESTSTVILQFLAIRRGLEPHALKDAPKEEIRPDLIEAGDFMVGAIEKMSAPAAKDRELIDGSLYRVPSALVRTLYLNGVNIIDGVRRVGELTHAKEHLDWNGVRSVTIWIEKSQGPVIPDNTELTALHADETIMNDDSLEDLQKKLLDNVLVKYFGEQTDLDKAVAVSPTPGAAIDAAAAAGGKTPVRDDLG